MRITSLNDGQTRDQISKSLLARDFKTDDIYPSSIKDLRILASDRGHHLPDTDASQGIENAVDLAIRHWTEREARLEI